MASSGGGYNLYPKIFRGGDSVLKHNTFLKTTSSWEVISDRSLKLTFFSEI